MDFWDLTKVIFRRWYVSLPLILLSFGSSLWVYATVDPDYKATAYVSLIPPRAPTDPDELVRNPYLDLGLLALNQSAVTVLREREFLQSLVDKGLSDNIAVDEGYPAPIITIQVIGNSEQQALGTADEVVRRYSDAVLSLQTDASATPNSIIAPKRLDQGGNFEVMGGPVKRAVIAVFAAGMMVSTGATVGVDAYLRRRGSRQQELADQAEADRLRADPTAIAPIPIPVAVSPAAVAPSPVSATVRDEEPEASRSSMTNTVVRVTPDARESASSTTIVLPLAFRTPNGRGGKRG